jgi:cellulose synthase/poly-beta-1,6-N-acetylglucosamine synthase-like glycosyltransferase
MATLFWLCFAVVAYVYFGYPLLLKSGLLGRRKIWRRGRAQPLLSVIVAAHNEESVIETKILNLLASDYPGELLEILVGSDGSSDRTEDIVSKYRSSGVGLISFPQQQGKSAMQNGLVAAASGSILVFTDADCTFPAQALRHLVENFADSRIGVVTARPRYQNELETSTTQNESLYLRYETWLRAKESDRGLLAMASGSLFAMRRDLWRPLNPHFGDDFALPLQAALGRMHTVLDPRAVAHTRLTQDSPNSMLTLKVRIVSKDLRALLAYPALLNPMRYGAVSVGLWSHKLLRWLVPYFLLALFVSCVFLGRAPFFGALLFLQLVFYSAAFAGFARRERAPAFPWSIPMSFCVVNAAALLGILKCLSGRTSGRWKTVRGQSAAL